MLESPPPLSRSQQARKTKILNAAMALFAEQGLRATTMEQISREAGVAKGTLYKYFPDKDAVTAEAAELTAGQIEAEVMTALSESHDPIIAITRALQTKTTYILEWTGSQNLASEIYEAGNRLISQHFADLEKRLADAIALRVEELGVADSEAAQVAQLLLRIGNGLKTSAESATQLKAETAQVAAALLKSLQAGS